MAEIWVCVKDQSKVKELEAIVRDEILKDLPDTQTFSQQGNLFGGLETVAQSTYIFKVPTRKNARHRSANV